MGLDSVELLLAVEDTFQIHFEDEEVARVATFDDLLELILSKREAPISGGCLTSVAFYRIRRALVGSLDANRREVRTWTPLELLLPRDGRREKWQCIQDRLKLKLPQLVHPMWIQTSLLFAAVASTIALGIRAGVRGWWLAVSCLIGPLVGGLLIRLSPWLASEFPNGNVTVGDLARDVLAANYRQLAAEVGRQSKRDVWETLRRVIVAQTGVDAASIKPGAPLMETLRFD